MRAAVILAAVPVAICWWVGCVALYVAALAGFPRLTEPLFLPVFFGSMAVGVLASQALRLSGAADRLPRPAVAVFCACGFLCMMGQAVAEWRVTAGDLSGGAALGEGGDRYLNSHGTRLRSLTEAEYQYIGAAKWRQLTAFLVGFASVVLGMALHSRGAWRAQQPGPQSARVQPEVNVSIR